MMYLMSVRDRAFRTFYRLIAIRMFSCFLALAGSPRLPINLDMNSKRRRLPVWSQTA